MVVKGSKTPRSLGRWESTVPTWYLVRTPPVSYTHLGDLKMIKLLLKYHADIKLVDEKNLSVIRCV